MRAARRLIALLTAVAAPLVTDAQPTPSQASQPDFIPRELAMALLNLSGSGPGGADIRIGGSPETAPPEFVPPGAQVMGSMTRFGSTTLVLAFLEKPDSAIALTEAHLLASGWTRPMTPFARSMSRGFVSDFAGAVNQMPKVMCRAKAFANLSAMYRISGGSLLKLEYNRDGRMPWCTGESEQESMRAPYDGAPIPTLRAPAGSVSSGGGGMSSSGRSDVSLSTRLSTKLTPAELIAHYDTQMRSEGWTSVLEGAVEFLSARTYRKADEKERVWFAMLFAMSVADGLEKDVSLRLSRR